MKGVAEDISGPVDERNQNSKFYQMVQLYRRYEAEESWSTEKGFQTYLSFNLTDEIDLVSLIRTIVREEVHRLVNRQESLDSDPQSLERSFKTKLKGFWPQCQQNRK
ncbi:hypothetical protein TNCV_1819691 [Trichonephila clavipes]|nr:hypothetical protein TNCV_1819691 [Trichonephila clavipes]